MSLFDESCKYAVGPKGVRSGHHGKLADFWLFETVVVGTAERYGPGHCAGRTFLHRPGAV